MVTSKVRKGFLLDTASDTLGALEDLRSLQRTTAENWGSNTENSTTSWGSGAEWDKYSNDKSTCGWGVASTSECARDDPMTDGSNNHQSNAKLSIDSILENRPFLPLNLGVPKNVISVWYGRRHKDVTFAANTCFTTWDDKGPAHARYFTSVFTCPVSGELFSCGRHGDKTSYKIENEEISQGIEEHDDGISETKVVSIVWYRKKSLAEHSAAARALDCLSFREGDGIDTMSYGLCIDKPYMTASEAPPLSTSAPKDLSYLLVDEMQSSDTQEKTEILDESFKTTLVVDEKLRSEFELVYESVIAKRETAKGALIKWYDKHLTEIPISSSCFTIWHDNGKAHERRYTGIFKCPLTGEIFCCGQYDKVENYLVKEEEMNVLVVWYRKKVMVEHAAAARALDCMNSREMRAHRSSIRLCVEEPYLSFDDSPPLSSLAPAELYA